MSVDLKAAWRSWSVLTRLVALLTALFLLLWPVSQLQNALGGTARDLWILAGGLLLVCAIPWGIRQARMRFLYPQSITINCKRIMSPGVICFCPRSKAQAFALFVPTVLTTL